MSWILFQNWFCVPGRRLELIMARYAMLLEDWVKENVSNALLKVFAGAGNGIILFASFELFDQEVSALNVCAGVGTLLLPLASSTSLALSDGEGLGPSPAIGTARLALSLVLLMLLSAVAA
ncbi:hypothetical protein ACA910_011162 [Epithemia clementina (nom. ined.)]